MKKSILFIAFLAFTIIVSAQKKDRRLVGLDKQLNEILTTWNAAGFSVSVVEKDKIIYAKGFGYGDYENKVPADANTVYAIGSCTKAFTSSLLGILRKDDLVDFDESPRKYIPYLKFYNDGMNNNIKVKDLMTHRTGLPRHDYSWYIFNTINKDSLLKRVQYQEPFTGVREKWYYNNFMYLAQGVITEKITGKSWEESIQEHFFKPLNMNRSSVGIDGLKKGNNAAIGYELKDDKIKKMDYYDISGMGAAGSINSSVNEMSNWLIAWINEGKYQGKEIIPAPYVEEAKSSQMVITGALPSKEQPDMFFANYGYGWFVASYKGHYRVEHGGNIDGFSASASFFPSDSIGIIVLANQNGSSVPAVVRNTIADRMLGAKVENWNKKLRERQNEAKKKQKEATEGVTSNKVEGTKPSHAMISFTGTYENPGYGKFEVVITNDSLFAKFPSMKFWLRHHHYDVFKPYLLEDDGSVDISEDDGLGLTIGFNTENDGEIGGLAINLEPALDAIEFKRKPLSVEIDAKTLEVYVGEYDLAGQTIKIYTKNDTTLYAFVAGQPEYELVATGKDKFVIKILNGYKLEFMSDDKGAVNEVLFKQPNGNFKAVRKK